MVELILGIAIVVFGIIKTAHHEHHSYKWDKTHYKDTINLDEYSPLIKNDEKDSTKTN